MGRGARRSRPSLALAPEAELPRGRAHEVCGPSRLAFAALVAGRTRGPVLWLRMARAEGALDPEGLAEFFDPSRVVIGLCRKPEDALWCAEEALRSRAVPLVIAELGAPPALTPVRRLHLAAEAEGEAPLALLLTPEGGAQGVETRWRLSPARAASWDEPAWTLERLRARLAPPRRWRAVWRAGEGAARLDLSPEGAPADQVLA